MADQQQIIQQAAQRNGVSPKVLWAIYGAESSWGKARSSFGLTGDYPGVGTSGNFTKDANRSAQILARLTREQGSLEGALRKYSGGSYGVAHVNDLLRTKPYGSSPYAPLVSSALKPAATSTSPQAPGLPNRQQLALSLLGFGGGQANVTDPMAVALGRLSQSSSPTGTTAPPAGIPSSSPAGGGGAKGVATFEGKPVAAWIKPWLVKARQAGWQGTVSSGYRSFADQTRIYNSGVRPAAKPGTSNHEFTAFPGGAVDVTDASQLSQVLSRLGAPLKWAGAKDPVHFSVPHNGSY